MFKAVPAIVFIAASTVEQFKSGNLVSAISLNLDISIFRVLVLYPETINFC